MAITSIRTAQNVNLSYHIVGIVERALGYLIDLGLFIVYFFLVGIVINFSGEDFGDVLFEFGLYNLLSFPVFFYSLYMHIIFNGRTVGKFIMKTRVVKEDGSPMEWSNYLVRWMLRIVDLWFPMLFTIGPISIMLSDKRQRLGDMSAGSIVISTKQRTQISHTILEEISEDYTPTFTNVTLLSDKDIRITKEVFSRAVKNRDSKTIILLRRKLDSILQTPSDLYDKPFIETILKDYNYYTQHGE